MTGTIGFCAGALSIGLFAVTANRAYRFVEPRKLQLFVIAFAFFAVAMLFWAFAASASRAVVVPRLLFASDVLLLAGTFAMVGVVLGQIRPFMIIVLGMIGAVLLSLRAFVYPPVGYVHDGILYFNLNGGVRAVILLAFVLVWLPAMISVANSVSRDPMLKSVRTSLTSCFIALIAVSGLFLSARRASAIITLFALIAALFLVMAVLNLLIIRVHQTEPLPVTPPKKKRKVAAHATHAK